MNSYTETPDEIRMRDGRPALRQEQLAILKFVQIKGKEGTVPGAARQSREPREAPSTIVHLSTTTI
ncbi:MAG: hypothetical protein J5U17_06155 [Candidatus Methanoperedens sp.]|nr:hypothetical protein [Candidatus Methanoperedens sp.]MCE8428443.1 hypothetical protein [Candidatus Methanoperedens sp.]